MISDFGLGLDNNKYRALVRLHLHYLYHPPERSGESAGWRRGGGQRESRAGGGHHRGPFRGHINGRGEHREDRVRGGGVVCPASRMGHTE